MARAGRADPVSALLGMLVVFRFHRPDSRHRVAVGGIVVSLVAWFYTVFRFAEDHLVHPVMMKFVVRIHPAVGADYPSMQVRLRWWGWRR